MALGTEVGLSPGDFVLDEDTASPPKGGGAPLPIFGPFLLQTNGWCIKVTIGIEVCLHPGDFVLDGDPAPSQKGGGARGRCPPIFGPCLLWSNGWMDEDGT